VTAGTRKQGACGTPGKPTYDHIILTENSSGWQNKPDTRAAAGCGERARNNSRNRVDALIGVHLLAVAHACCLFRNLTAHAIHRLSHATGLSTCGFDRRIS